MSKKPYTNKAFSREKKCKRCGKPLKLNLLIKKPKATYCYRCYEIVVLQPRRENAPKE